MDMMDLDSFADDPLLLLEVPSSTEGGDVRAGSSVYSFEDPDFVGMPTTAPSVSPGTSPLYRGSIMEEDDDADCLSFRNQQQPMEDDRTFASFGGVTCMSVASHSVDHSLASSHQDNQHQRRLSSQSGLSDFPSSSGCRRPVGREVLPRRGKDERQQAIEPMRAALLGAHRTNHCWPLLDMVWYKFERRTL
jgi:hypothetical protein